MKVTIRHHGGDRDGELEEFADPARLGIGETIDKAADCPSAILHASRGASAEPAGDEDRSAEFAEICFDGRCFRIETKPSSRATRVNGKRIQSVQLANGDLIEFGEHGPKLEINFDLELPDDLLAQRKSRLHERLLHLRRRTSVGLVVIALLVCWILSLSLRTDRLVQDEERARESAEREVILLNRSLEELRAELEIQDDQRRVSAREASVAREEAHRLQARIMAESQRLLEERLQDLAAARENRDTTVIEELQREIGGLRAELGRNAPLNLVLQNILEANDASVLLLYVEYDYLLLTPTGPVSKTAGGWGTGFFVTDEGHIITNKHVVQPWKFDREMAALAAGGFVDLDATTTRISAWRGGSAAFNSQGQPDYLKGFNTHALGNLKLVKTAPDRMTERVLALGDGTRLLVKLHPLDNGDLALLQAQGEIFRPLRLKSNTSEPNVRKLDPVMVIGFPQGRGILEAAIAETSPSTGTVRKVEDTIYVTASIIPGNSGGPVFAADGEVIGIATRVISETLGICIRIEHAQELLR